MKPVLNRQKSADEPEQRKSLRVMHIVINLEIGGAQEVVHTLAKYMAKGGHKLVVCSFKDGPLRQKIERLGIPVEILPDRRYSILVPHLFILEMLSIRKELVRLLLKYQIEIVQTHLLQSLDFLVATLYFLTDAPSIYWTVHNYHFVLRREDLPRFHWLLVPKRIAYRLMWQLVIHWVTGVIAVSEEVKEAILGKIGFAVADKIIVINNGVDAERYQKPIDKRQLRQFLGLGANHYLILVVAMFREQKGHYYLINAAAHILPRLPDLRILLVGDGKLRERLLTQTRSLGLEKQILFLGIREDIPDLLAGSDCFVLPSLWEGLPMSLVEAMASGLPIVATEVSGSKQVMLSGVTGLLVPPADSHELAQAIVEIVTQPTRAAKMGQAARQLIEKEYSASKQAGEYINLYQERYQALARGKSEHDFSKNIRA
jgi:glycosyltransferase involved in cell wall biosynthesis